MRYFSLVLLCLTAFSLTACSDKKAQQAQQRQRNSELAIEDLQVSVTDMNQRLTDMDQRLATTNTEMAVLKHHPYPVKTLRGAKTNYIAGAPSMPGPTPLTPTEPAPRAAEASAGSPWIPPPGPRPSTQTPKHGWLPSVAPPPSPAGTGARGVPGPAANSIFPQDQPQNSAAQSKRPVGLNELALPPETQADMTSFPGAPAAASAPAARSGRASASPNASGQPEETLYNKALADFNAGKHAQAAAGFTELIYAYPAGRYAPNAGYWLGESLYGQSQYNDALAQFKEVTSRFPQHHKAPDALFKAGLCYARLGDRENSALQFRNLVANYPNSPAANLARQRGFVR